MHPGVRFSAGLLLAMGCSHSITASGRQVPEAAIQQPAERLDWRPAPEGLPAGTRMALLEGDPSRAGLFTLRLRIPAGTRLPPHWHPQPERVTVLEGSVRVGFGAVYKESQLRTFGAGSYYVNPPGAVHFIDFPTAATVQITTEGPWLLHPVEPH